MSDKPEYRFRCQIINADTGEVIEVDWFTLTDLDADAEKLNIHGGQLLRNWHDFARAEYEAATAPNVDEEAAE